jgi:hypothetical protein
MTRTKSAARRTLGCTVGALLLAGSQGAWAGPLRINFGGDTDPTDATEFDWGGSFDDQIDVSNGTFQGTLFPFPSPGLTTQDIAGPPTETADAFNDGLLIGGISYNSFCIAEQGRVWFTAGGACGDFNNPDAALFSVLGLGALDYTFNPDTPPTDGLSPSVSVSLGMEDRDLDGGGLDLANADPVLRVFWRQLSTGDATIPLIDVQALFHDLGGGNFDVEFLYGGDYTSLGAIQAISAPGITGYSGTPALTGAATDPFFSFRGGLLTIGGGGDPPDPPVPVPEPTTLSLLLVGALGLLAAPARIRRRRAV